MDKNQNVSERDTSRDYERERERTLSKLEGNKIETSGGFERERERERKSIYIQEKFQFNPYILGVVTN